MTIKERLEKVKKVTDTVEGWFSFAEGSFLYKTARRVSGRGAIVEIGSWKGKSTIWLANGLRDGAGGKVFAIDPHTGAPEHHEIFKIKDIWTFDEFRANIEKAGVREFVEPIVDRSENVAKRWEKPVAFLWIDGAHAYEAAKLDFNSWFPHLMEGGVAAYHDATFDDVKRVIKECMLFSHNFKDAGVVDSIVYATRVSPEKQTWYDRLRNRYVYFLVVLYGLRRIPIPGFLRKGLKTVFKKVIGGVQ